MISLTAARGTHSFLPNHYPYSAYPLFYSLMLPAYPSTPHTYPSLPFTHTRTVHPRKVLQISILYFTHIHVCIDIQVFISIPSTYIYIYILPPTYICAPPLPPTFASLSLQMTSRYNNKGRPTTAPCLGSYKLVCVVLSTSIPPMYPCTPHKYPSLTYTHGQYGMCV